MDGPMRMNGGGGTDQDDEGYQGSAHYANVVLKTVDGGVKRNRGAIPLGDLDKLVR